MSRAMFNKVQETTGTLEVDPYFGPFVLEVSPVHAGGLFDLLIMCTRRQCTLSLKTGLCSVSRAAHVSAVALVQPTLSCHVETLRNRCSAVGGDVGGARNGSGDRACASGPSLLFVVECHTHMET